MAGYEKSVSEVAAEHLRRMAEQARDRQDNAMAEHMTYIQKMREAHPQETAGKSALEMLQERKSQEEELRKAGI